jgi:glycosyltransferase involved in cell wall biosynthesis
VSEQVREDLLSRYGRRAARRVVAIPNAISWERFKEPGGAPLTAGGERYVLSVSAQYPHKNLSTLLEAFALLRRRGGFDNVTLVLVGQWSDKLIGIARTVDLKGEAARLELGDAVRFTGYVSDADVGDLYRGASAFVFPSLFEGFGMPAVEALGFGIPVLTTRRTAIPETTLGLATYLDDPLDTRAMADALATILERPDEHRPSKESVERIRETYAPERIGALYRAELLG